MNDIPCSKGPGVMTNCGLRTVFFKSFASLPLMDFRAWESTGTNIIASGMVEYAAYPYFWRILWNDSNSKISRFFTGEIPKHILSNLQGIQYLSFKYRCHTPMWLLVICFWEILRVFILLALKLCSPKKGVSSTPRLKVTETLISWAYNEVTVSVNISKIKLQYVIRWQILLKCRI